MPLGGWIERDRELSRECPTREEIVKFDRVMKQNVLAIETREDGIS